MERETGIGTMIGGTVLENRLTTSPNRVAVRQLWCIDTRNPNDECAVFADPDEAADVRPGDRIWWQSGKIFWSRHGEFHDKQIKKIGYSFDPREID